MPMYNLIEYSDNYQDSSATLYQYKRDEPPDDIANNLTQNSSTSFDYKIKLLGNPELIEQTIYILWVQALHKVFMILRYMQKKTFTETLQTPVKILC